MKTTNSKLSAGNALALAKAFRESSIALGNYTYANRTKISKNKLRELDSLEQKLLIHATTLTTQAVDIVLDEGQGKLQALIDATKKAKIVLKKITSAKKAIKVATALIGLAAAIPTGNFESIYSALNVVKDTIKDKKADK